MRHNFMGHIFYDIFEIKLVNSVAMFTQAQLRDCPFSFIHMKLNKNTHPRNYLNHIQNISCHNCVASPSSINIAFLFHDAAIIIVCHAEPIHLRHPTRCISSARQFPNLNSGREIQKPISFIFVSIFTLVIGNQHTLSHTHTHKHSQMNTEHGMRFEFRI